MVALWNTKTPMKVPTCSCKQRSSDCQCGGNRVNGLNGLPVILPRVIHISTDMNREGIEVFISTQHIFHTENENNLTLNP
jgi:hypothetical protein